MEWFENWFDSKYYHILYSKRNSDEAGKLINNLINQLKPSKNDQFLDLGCGTGRHAKYLNKYGFSVDGFDISKKSLIEAKKMENKKLKFYLKDMRFFNEKNKYNYILNLFTSFGYFQNEEDDQKVFTNIEQSLKRGGYFILDFFNSTKIITDLIPFEIKKINNIEFKIKKHYDDKFIYKNISITDKSNKHNFTEKVKLITEKKFINYAKRVNLKLLTKYGDYDLNQYNNSSERLILVFKKPN